MVFASLVIVFVTQVQGDQDLRDGLTREKVAFAFSGLIPVSGSGVWPLAALEPRFAEALTECDEVLAQEVGWSLLSTLEELPEGQTLTRPRQIFPILVALQIAMFRLLRHYGVDAGSVVGISCGEVTAAYAAGALSLREALRIPAQAGRLLQAEAENCRMARVWLSADECAEVLASQNGRLEVAAFMEPDISVVSGEQHSIAGLLETLAARSIRAQMMFSEWGGHTSMLSGGCSAFEAAVPPIVPRATKRRLMSTERGEWMESGFDVAHWSRLVKEPVLFYPAVERMRAKGIDTFIDVGPGASMSYLIKRLGGQVLSFSQALAAAKQAVDCAVPKPMALRRSEISL